MTEAVLALLPFLFDVLRLSRVTIEPFVQDNGSLSLARKVGAVRAPRKSDEISTARVVGANSPVVCFEITREKWYAREDTGEEPTYDPSHKTCRW